MKPTFLDTNIFVKAFVLDEDHPEYTQKCKELIRNLIYDKLEGYTSSIHINETAIVLERSYKAKRETIANDLLQLVDLESLKIKNKPILQRALLIYLTAKSEVSLADAYAVAEAEELRLETIMSYDTDFDQFSHMRRIEPS